MYRPTLARIKFIYWRKNTETRMRYICILLLLLSFTNSFSQDATNTSAVHPGKGVALASFDKLYFDQLPISKGVIFRPIDSKLYAGSTYLGEKQNYLGDVFYQKEWYTGLTLIYDVYTDQLIHIKPTGEGIVLVKPEVEAFTLEGRRFINNPAVEGQGPSFFELILAGKAEVLVKHSIKIGNYNVRTLQRPLQNRTRLIIYNAGDYYEINGRSDVLAALKNKRSEISAFIKNQKPDFKNSLEESVKRIVVYFNQLP